MSFGAFSGLVRARVGQCIAVAASALAACAAHAQPEDIGVAPVLLDDGPYVFDTAEQHGIQVDVVVRGLANPFSLAFLPNGDALISERGGALRIVREATGPAATLVADPVQGAPAAAAARGAGLHEVTAHPDFERNRLVYLTYNDAHEPASASGPAGPTLITLKVARARFDDGRLEDFEDIYSAGARAGGSGSRLAFAPDGMLFVTTGAPFGDEARRLDSAYGKVLRLDEDGNAPADNPFVGRDGVRPEIYSMGHRDQLGLTLHPETGDVLAAEHGPNGGDEVNLILPGSDYGWPTYSYGRNYDGPRVSAVPVADGIEQPLVLWSPSIAPTGLTFYSGDGIGAWAGNLFVGSARRGQIPRTGGLERVVLNDQLEELRREPLLTELRQRIRDVREGPDGLLYVITDEEDGALLRISAASLD